MIANTRVEVWRASERFCCLLEGVGEERVQFKMIGSRPVDMC